MLWFSGILVKAGYAAFPAESLRRAMALARHADDFILLAVNPGLTGTAELINALRRRQPALKVIALVASGGARVSVHVDASIGKSPDEERDTTTRMIRLVDRLLFQVEAA